MRAMVLAAGMGTRLQPLTHLWPKCLMPVANQPLLDITLKKLAKLGTVKTVVNTHYLAKQVTNYLQYQQTMTVDISHEPQLLGTGGALVKAAHLLGNAPFWHMNADIYCDADLAQMSRLMRQNNPVAVLGLVNEPRFNSVAIDDTGRLLGVKGYLELPTGIPLYTYSGMALLHPRLLEYLPAKGPSNLVDAWHMALKAGETILCCQLDGLWSDLGTWQDLWQANYNLAQNHPVLAADSAQISVQATVQGFCFASESCIIESGAFVKDSLLLPGARVNSGAKVEHAILGKDFIASGEYVNGAFA